MPLQTSTPTLTNTLRNKLASPFDEEERKKLLGNSSALEAQLNTFSGALSPFDATAERGARTGLLEQQAQQARENIARTFALDPSGIQTGSAIRPFSAIEGARLSNLAALESELSQRAGAENRANLGALQSLQGQQQGLNLNAAGLQLQGLGQLQNQIQFDAGQGLTREQMAQQNEQFGRSLGERGRQFDVGQNFAQQQAIGNIGGIDTLAARQLEGQLGLSERQLEQQGTQFERSLAEQAAAREAQNRLAEGQLLGNLGGQDTLASQQLAAQLGLDTQRLQEQIAARQEANALQRLGLTGTEGGGETIALQQLRQQDAQFGAQLAQRASEFARQYGLQESELFGGGPSVTYTADEINNTPVNTRQGDPGFRPELDVDGNGVYEFADFLQLRQQSADLGNGVLQYIPDEGRRTLAQQQLDLANANAAREFGLDEAKLAEASRQFDEQFGQAKNEWQTATTGFIYDDNGNVKSRWDVGPNGMPIEVPLTTLERDQFTEQKRQFNAKIQFDIQKLADELDIDLKKIDATKFAALMGVVGSIANAAGTVIGNNPNGGRTQTNFASPFSIGYGPGQFTLQ